jgi:large subunit ribosomal protein L5
MAEKGPKGGQQKGGQTKGGQPDKGGQRAKGKKGAPQEQQAAEQAQAAAEPEEKIPARLRLRYESEIMPELMRELKIENRMRAPRLSKIVINLALGEARENVKLLDSAAEELRVITGQKPVITKARKAISNFKLREGMPIGAMVTLRRERMYEFYDRLVNIALPRVRDFRGVSDKSFDGRGNYSLGIREHTIFPELNLDKVDKVKGLTISIITTARSDNEGYMLLRALGMPFRSAGGDQAVRPAA